MLLGGVLREKKAPFRRNTVLSVLAGHAHEEHGCGIGHSGEFTAALIFFQGRKLKSSLSDLH